MCKIERIFLARSRIKLGIFISFLPNKLGNNNRIAGQNLTNIKNFLIIFDQPFIAQLNLPNMKKKTVKTLQLLGNKSPTRFNKYCW